MDICRWVSSVDEYLTQIHSFLVKHTGNLTLDQIIDVARKMRFKSLAKELRGTVREILGTAFSVGCTVDGQNPKDLCAAIDAGEVEIPVSD